MKKIKLSWKHFLIVVLAILILIGFASVIKNYSNSSEGMTDMIQSDNKESCKNAYDPFKIIEGPNRSITIECSGNQPITTDFSGNKVKLTCPPSKNNEAFSNMTLNASPLNNSPLPCIDPLLPYEKNNCGPIDINKFFFDEIEFKPECCPSTYSSSMGCACMCPEQLTYLNSRAGNRNFSTMY